MSGNTLMAHPFDAGGLKFTGQAVPIAENVGVLTGPEYGYFSVSPAGLLCYQAAPSATDAQMVWFNREGQKVGTVGQPDIYSNPAISPEGTKLAVGVGDHGKRDIWAYDLKRGTASRLTFNPADDLDPVWSEDGSRIFFSSIRLGHYDIYQKAADGLGSTQLVVQSKQAKDLDDLPADGHYAVYDTAAGPGATQLFGLPLLGDRKPFAFVQGSFGAHSARFSPNGRYLAYDSNETGRNEVYVQTFR